MVGGLFQGGGQNEANRNIQTENALRGSLAGFQAKNPFSISGKAAKGDIAKAYGGSIGSLIDQKTYDQIGSSNENLLGINKSIDDIVKQAGFKEEKGKPFWKKLLGAVAPIAIQAFLPGAGGGGG
jgi:hypothetical protein